MTTKSVIPSTNMTQLGGRKKKKKLITTGPIRTNLEAFGVAILGAVLLKWYCLEAFQIPTSSMQPTLMGSNEASVYDRLLVDKLLPTFRDPKRWDVTVFGYPLQKNQNYVKRLVGLPGDKLLIAGGNLYLVDVADGKRTYNPLRKPARIQELFWKEVFPARQLVRGDNKALGGLLFATPSDSWKELDGAFTIDLKGQNRPAWLTFDDSAAGGFIDLVWDGYPTSTAAAIRERAGSNGNEIVPDARIEATFTPADQIDELQMQVDVLRPDRDRLNFALVVKGGKGTLEVRGKDDTKPLLISNAFVCELTPLRATSICFAHLDDMLYAWRDGQQMLELDVAAYHCREGCELESPQAKDNQRVKPQILIKGKGKLEISGLRICRDLQYTTRGFEELRSTLKKDGFITVPDGNYFMMGDNTQQSIDSRGWTALRLGVTADNTVIPLTEVDPVKNPGSHTLRGNKRTVPPTSPPDRDETPVIIASRDMLAMIDEFGETHALKARISKPFRDQVAGSERADFAIEKLGAQDGRSDWQPPEEWVPFVRREHIRGRALLIFWRWPFPRCSPIK